MKTSNGHNPAFSQMETSEKEAGFNFLGKGGFIKALTVILAVFAIIGAVSNSAIGGWTVMDSGTIEHLTGVWASAADNVFVVGECAAQLIMTESSRIIG